MEDGLFWVNEGFVLNDAGHTIVTTYIDLRQPEDRSPITELVRGCERKYALEDCDTILISKPARYRSFGEELILDVQEGLATEESIISEQETSAQATRRRAVTDLNQALEMFGVAHCAPHTANPIPTQRHTQRASLMAMSGGS